MNDYNNHIVNMNMLSTVQKEVQPVVETAIQKKLRIKELKEASIKRYMVQFLNIMLTLF